VLLIGQYEHTIDAKGRLAVPAEVRSRWSAQEHGSAWYAVPWPGGVIRLYTERSFEQRAQAALPETLTPNDVQAKIQSRLFSMSRRLEMDASGRVRLPEALLAATGIGREVALVGCGDRFEILDRDAWRQQSKDALDELPGLLDQLEQLRQRG
jgi:MraZ protein